MGIRLRKGIYYFRSRMVKGRREEVSLQTANKKEAERLAAKKEVEFYDTQQWGSKVRTWGEWVGVFTSTYLGQYKNQYGFTRLFNKHTKNWNAWKIGDIEPKHTEMYVSRRLAEGAPPSTVGLEWRLLRVVCEKAKQDGVIERNPFGKRSTIQLKSLPRMRVLTFEEEQKLLNACSPKMQKIVRLFLITGLRAAELLSASPAHLVQLPRIGLRVVGKGMKIRVVPLTDEGKELVQRVLPLTVDHRVLLLNLERAAIKAGLTEPSKGKKKASPGLKASITLHDLRRTFATRCAEEQMPIETLAEILGHSSIATTAKYYVHLTSVNSSDALLSVLRAPRFGGLMGESGGDAKNPPKHSAKS